MNFDGVLLIDFEALHALLGRDNVNGYFAECNFVGWDTEFSLQSMAILQP